MSKNSAILLIACPDQPGLVATITHFIHINNGNIVHLDQHVDFEQNVFFMRIEWILDAFEVPRADLPDALRRIADPLGMHWELYFSDENIRLALFVSKANHCLYDLLARHETGEFQAEIPLIISNHDHLRPAAERFGIPYHVFPITRDTKRSQEKAEIALMEEHQIDTVIMARYMQILSEDFISHYPHNIINIHHSFLPAFAGAKPYHQAYERGVKIIGATSHYATSELDEGPIIEQDVIHVSHKESVDDFIRRGRDLEKAVLSRAIWWHTQRKILCYNNKTVIFK